VQGKSYFVKDDTGNCRDLQLPAADYFLRAQRSALC
jgi:hypothetical protein